MGDRGIGHNSVCSNEVIFTFVLTSLLLVQIHRLLPSTSTFSGKVPRFNSCLVAGYFAVVLVRLYTVGF